MFKKRERSTGDTPPLLRLSPGVLLPEQVLLALFLFLWTLELVAHRCFATAAKRAGRNGSW